MSTQLAHAGRSATLERLLARHREEAQRLRDQYGDPTEMLGWIVRDSFDRESLEAAFRDLTEGGSFWNDDEQHER